MPSTRFEAILDALDEASGNDVPLRWSSWRYVIAAGIEAALDHGRLVPVPSCPGCGSTEGSECTESCTPANHRVARVTWTCCGTRRDYETWEQYRERYGNALNGG